VQFLLARLLMLQKESWLFSADNTNVRWIKIFQLYKGFHRKQTTIGFYVKGSARVVEPPRVEYKGFKYKYSIKGDIIRMLFIRSNSFEKTSIESRIKFNANCGLTIKKKNDLKSKYTNGPVCRNLNRKKMLTLFKRVVF